MKKKEKSEKLGRVPTEMELILEHTQQGITYEVSPKKPPSPDRDWNKTLPAAPGNTQTWISELAKQANSRSTFNELLDTPLDFSNFIMNRLRVDTLTPELLDGPTYELMKGSCNSLTELEYHLEEVYKATTDQLDWVNPEGQQYPHNLLQPLPLIPNNQGHRVIPFAYFINNDLEYLRGGASSRKYTTSFYGSTVNRESTLDVYSKRRIIFVTDLKIVEWHNYKHLDWISIHRDDDKIHKFKEGEFKRLRLQDIKDMLLLLVQGKLSNLTEPIVSTSSPTLTPFGDIDFLLEETDDFLAIEDEPISSEIDDSYYDSEGGILLLEEFLYDDPSSPPLHP
nr:reverse transcriptase domain-containing protein [Tanacetum cinerariifolium]